MSARDLCLLLDEYVAQCWSKYSNVVDVHNAIDAFMVEINSSIKLKE